jgi:hypothetical protein
MLIPFEREKEYAVNYKTLFRNINFCADFIVFESIILEINLAECL